MSKFSKARRQGVIEPLVLEPDKTVVPFSDDPLMFELRAANGLYVNVDLRRYRDGDSALGFAGFPDLMTDLLPAIKQGIGPHPTSPRTARYWLDIRLIVMFKWLTSLERKIGAAPRRAADFDESHGELFKRFLLSKGGNLRPRKKQYTAIWTLLTNARGEGAPPLLWPSFEISEVRTVHPDVDPRAVKALYNACKRVMSEADSNLRQGRKWLTDGVDPRTIEGERQRYQKGRRGSVKNTAWYSHANLAVLTQLLMRDRILGSAEVDKSVRTKLNNLTSIEKSKGALVSRQELWSTIAATPMETAAAILIVSMETGWIDTVANIDLSGSWYSLRGRVNPHTPGKTDTVVIKAVRPKTGKTVLAVGMAGSRFRSYQVIRFMEERSAFLRSCLQQRRDLLAAQASANASRREIAEIDVKLRSPWLFWNSKGKGLKATGATRFGQLMADQLPVLKKRAIAALKPSQRSDRDLIAAINALTWSDMRDAFAVHIYDSSGGNIFLVKQHLAHSDVRTSRFYLRQRRQILQRFDAFRKVVDTALAEVNEGRGVDPTILFLANNYRDFSQADRERLAHFRTRVGMGCSNPFDPDRHLAPHHPAGALCAVQRCILCRHGIVFPQAFEGLADRHADLLWLRSNTPPNRWLTSTFSWELEAIEYVRDRVFSGSIAEFSARSEGRLADINSGITYVLDEPEIARKHLWTP